MANLPNVNPGDLIQAAYINSLVAAITDLQTRVSNLEAGQSQVTVTGITDNSGLTSGGFMAIGDLLSITGQNFAIPSSANQVSFGGITVNAFSGTNASTTLIGCQVPTIQLGPNNSPVSVPVVVSNANGKSVPWTISVGVSQQTGTVAVTYTGGSQALTPLGANASVTLQFSAQIVATLVRPATYTATVMITGAGWTAQLQGSQTLTVQPQNGLAVTAPPWSLPVTVTAPATNTSPNSPTATLTVTVSSSDPASTGSNNPPLTLTFGAAAGAADNRVTITEKTGGKLFTPSATPTTTGGTWELALTFALNPPTTQGTYVMSFPSPGTGWQVPSTVPAPLTSTNSSYPQNLTWTAPVGATATTSAQLQIQVTSSDASPAYSPTTFYFDVP